MDYNYRSYSAPYFEQFVSLLGRAFSTNNPHRAAVVRWKYFHPYVRGAHITQIALDASGALVGQYTNIPIALCSQGSTIKASACIDMCTDPDHRGRGIISALSKRVYREIKSQGYVCSFGFSNAQGIHVDTHSREYGYQVVGRFVRFLKLVLFPRASRFSLHSAESFSYHCEHQDSWIRIHKDSEYLQWRYRLKPHQNYSIFAIQEQKKVIGYVVLRQRFGITSVLDIITPHEDPESMLEIFTAIERQSVAHFAPLISCLVLGNSFWQQLFSRSGYLKIPDGNQQYYLTVNRHDRSEATDRLGDPEQWLLLSGDIL